MTWQFMAQRARTGEWLTRELPLRDPQLTFQLSGPPSLSATISPETAQATGDDGALLLDEWSTIIYAVESDEIRFGGIVVRCALEDGGGWSLECSGFSAYLKDTPYKAQWKKDSVDPLDAVRELWRHVQSFPNGDLGVVVDDTKSPVRIGKVVKHAAYPDDDSDVEYPVAADAEPYVLADYEAKDCGGELDQLAQQTPFDYTEEHTWDGEDVKHRFVIGYPRLGRRRDDVIFAIGENVTSVPLPERNGDEYANEVFILGKGEGTAKKKSTVAIDDGKLRRVAVRTASMETDTDRLNQLARQTLDRRNPLLTLSEITIDPEHDNAPLGSWQIGDDIEVRGELPWLGDFSLWCRVLGYTIQPVGGDGRATVQLARSDAFTYGEVWIG